MKFRDFLGIGLLVGIVAIGAPVIWVETACVEESRAAAPAPTSFLAYPELFVVDSYGEFAAVARQRSESAFDYGGAISNFWSSLCATTREASRYGEIPLDRKAGNYLVGYVFTAEMTLKGLWERTLGGLTAWMRGPVRTSEDEFGLQTLANYAAFLKTSPGGRFPFWQELDRFFKETPTSGDAAIRKGERRVLFTLEYVGRGLYAHPAFATGGSGADKAGPGSSHVLVTVLAPADRNLEAPGVRPIFSTPLQARPGWRRVGLDVEAASAPALQAGLAAQGVEFERAYR
ncbi:MAG: hypothetical protein U1E28_19560 [Beijerinckiaceae bacterium]